MSQIDRDLEVTHTRGGRTAFVTCCYESGLHGEAAVLDNENSTVNRDGFTAENGAHFAFQIGKSKPFPNVLYEEGGDAFE